MKKELLEKYARLLVCTGVAIQKGQLLVIWAPVEQYAFVRLIEEEAYRAGAGSVHVNWEDDELFRLALQHESFESLEKIMPWLVSRKEQQQKMGCAILKITMPKPDLLNGVDAKRIAARIKAERQAFYPLQDYTMNNHGQWCVAAASGPAWAHKIFPDEPIETAVDPLWEVIFQTIRLDADHDPREAWKRYSASLHKRCDFLNEAAFSYLHFKNELGTDLKVRLPKGHIWGGGSETALDNGVVFQPNMPTEEVFTTPHRLHVDGVVHASRPLVYNNQVIADFRLRFKDGVVVDYACEKGKEALEEILSADEHSRSLGEVALVPYDSPISRMPFLFYDTLFDENASCHLALGNSYPGMIRGGSAMSKEELLAHGGNVSSLHVDFMFGSRLMQVIGYKEDESAVTVIRDGNFTF